MQHINKIINALKKYQPQVDTTPIITAYNFSAKAHLNQLRRSGEPYLTHPLAVAFLIAEIHLDVPSICAALLHDTVEDNSTLLLKDIIKSLGSEIAALVDGVTKITLVATSTKNAKNTRQAESLRKMILAMAKDIRVLLVKLADRLHNMRTLNFLSLEKQYIIAHETLDIYAPMAHRLGIHKWQAELEDLSLYYLYPQFYQTIQNGIATHQNNRKKFINETRQQIQQMIATHSIQCYVDGRPKHLYSIYQKMQRQGINIDELYDLIAFRIIVKNIKDCYGALGIIHNTWKPIPGRFRDYIGMPKTNMYQSLHTSLIGPSGQRMEIQIRTEEMHRIAEEGIAAHWQYKEKIKNGSEGKHFSWLRRVLDWQRDLKDPSEFMQSLRMDLYPEEIFIFTPNGDVKELPKGATAIDFAYSIHTEIGHQCIGAKINNRIVPLRRQLFTGDQVEIITQHNHKPSKDWLGFVISSRARSKITSYIRENERAQAIILGRELIERELRKKKYNLNLNTIIKEGKLDSILTIFSFKEIGKLLAAIAYGKLSPRLIVNRLLPKKNIEPKNTDLLIYSLDKFQKCPSEGIKVKGINDILVKFAKCCNPLPGDLITGYISRGRGIIIHLTICPQLDKIEHEQRIEVEWDISEPQVRPVRLQIKSDDRSGILADLTNIFKQHKINILEANVHTTDDHCGIATFLIEVSDTNQLQKIIIDLKYIKDVNSVKRLGLVYTYSKKQKKLLFK